MGESSVQIVVVGAGGLGVAAGWGIAAGWSRERALELHIYDPDAIELSNLNRQVLFHTSDIGSSKAETLCRRLEPLACGSPIRFCPHQQRIDHYSIADALGGADLVIDACDSTETKFLLNDYCVAQSLPLIYGGAVAEQGLLMLIHGTGACLRCLFGEFDAAEIEQQSNACRRDGIFGSVVGQVGFLQAVYALRVLSQTSEPGTLIRTSLSDPETRETRVAAQPDCPLGCGSPATQKLDIRDKQCPDTFLYTKLALEELGAGESLDLRLGSEESLASVIETTGEEGYRQRITPREISAGNWRVVLEKP